MDYLRVEYTIMHAGYMCGFENDLLTNRIPQRETASSPLEVPILVVKQ